MEFVYGMNRVNVGAFPIKENMVGTREGIQACQQYGKAVGNKFYLECCTQGKKMLTESSLKCII